MKKIPPRDYSKPFYPPTHLAKKDPNGLLFFGGQFTLDWMQGAYQRGIFPWGRLRDHIDEPMPPLPPPHEDILWWTPTPRMVLKTDNFRWHRSLKKRWRQWQADGRYRVVFDADFLGTVQDCANIPRHYETGRITETWIEPALIKGYQAMYEAGLAHSVETWCEDRRIGGLYVVNIGQMVYGESMFSHVTDASKIALAALVQWMSAQGMTLIDCQQETSHLSSLGATGISREAFEAEIALRVDLAKPSWPQNTNLLTAFPQIPTKPASANFTKRAPPDHEP